jgi:hypothetical protein
MSTPPWQSPDRGWSEWNRHSNNSQQQRERQRRVLAREREQLYSENVYDDYQGSNTESNEDRGYDAVDVFERQKREAQRTWGFVPSHRHDFPPFDINQFFRNGSSAEYIREGGDFLYWVKLWLDMKPSKKAIRRLIADISNVIHNTQTRSCDKLRPTRTKCINPSYLMTDPGKEAYEQYYNNCIHLREASSELNIASNPTNVRDPNHEHEKRILRDCKIKFLQDQEKRYKRYLHEDQMTRTKRLSQERRRNRFKPYQKVSPRRLSNW